MPNFKYIKSFLFDKASYNLSDGKKDYITLDINYKENTYNAISKGESENRKFRSEIEEIAKDMLARKHGVNFAKIK